MIVWLTTRIGQVRTAIATKGVIPRLPCRTSTSSTS